MELAIQEMLETLVIQEILVLAVVVLAVDQQQLAGHMDVVLVEEQAL